ncbi:MAG: hypothetical protein SPG09_13385, partial [Lachnospiraceae bacterium]|nr:hypothetical protein [bacterium]MDY5518581.1 hypothetical protein [Lachnospiraceae bacterium]
AQSKSKSSFSLLPCDWLLDVVSTRTRRINDLSALGNRGACWVRIAVQLGKNQLYRSGKNDTAQKWFDLSDVCTMEMRLQIVEAFADTILL